MKSNANRCRVRNVAVLMLAAATGVMAQTAAAPTQFSGVIEDYTPQTNTPAGPWEMRGPWTLTLNGDGKADFSAELTMELSDFTRTPSNIDATSGANGRMQHTHHITLQGGAVTQISTGGFEVSGPVNITKDGSPAPLAASTLSVEIVGGTSVQFSNMTLQFGGGGTVHFGSQLIHAVVSSPKASGPGVATTPSGTNAIVTPTSLTTSQASVVLDGSGSTSASGSLRYLFQVVPGGKQAALLQTPTSSKATVDFVNGAGLYLVQLVVTDGTGATATSPVIMLTYQP
jgi:K319L-like, PKD domain